MTRSVEIPDAAVEAGVAAFERVPEKQGAVDDMEGQFRDAMRAALVAARPYLMPTREAVHAAIADELDGEGVVSYGLAPKLAARVMDLPNGAAS